MSSIISTSDLNPFTRKPLNSAVASQVVAAVNAYIERVTHRCWGETKTVTERYDYGSSLWLRHQDIRAVDLINFGYPGTTPIEIESDAYYCNSLGRLSFSTFPHGRRYADLPEWLEIEYTYGVEEVPDDLKLAALGIAAGFYNWATNDQKEVSEAQVGSYRLKYANGSGVATGGSDSTALSNFAVINSYATKRA
jgi:hypothetical protein